jgi:hypothetical protein
VTLNKPLFTYEEEGERGVLYWLALVGSILETVLHSPLHWPLHRPNHKQQSPVETGLSR